MTHCKALSCISLKNFAKHERNLLASFPSRIWEIMYFIQNMQITNKKVYQALNISYQNKNSLFKKKNKSILLKPTRGNLKEAIERKPDWYINVRMWHQSTLTTPTTPIVQVDDPCDASRSSSWCMGRCPLADQASLRLWCMAADQTLNPVRTAPG